MANLIFYFWIVINALLCIHVLQELVLMFSSFRSRKRNIDVILEDDLPMVTVQLPVYNEKFVIERLLNAISKLDYPKDKLEVQILDDSNDETSELIGEFIIKLNKDNFNFIHLQREDRSGFKAGALTYGMKWCRGEFIAIFDADFVPDSQFLKKTIPCFREERTGLVQTRWTHINEDDSILTKAQSVMLNTHFGIEQLGRSNAKGFINFNGTAGVWRKTCIEEAGGWQIDTLTEDLDLSFRAQSIGWKFKYLFDVGSPAELPATFQAYRTQQFRWSKGAAECLRKNFKMLWKSSAKTGAKIFGTFHLLNSSVYLLVVAILMISPVVFYLEKTQAITVSNRNVLQIMGSIGIYLLLIIFFVGNLKSSVNKVKSALFFIPSVLVYFAMTTGISIYMVIGVIEGYRGKRSDFIRTPKFGSQKGVLKLIHQGYDFKKEASIVVLEAICFSYGIFWIVVSLIDFNIVSLIYGLMITVGFSLSLFFKNATFRWNS